jgi:L-alanine-DL-glutamate epimerase-like enolase superfamily enzyme
MSDEVIRKALGAAVDTTFHIRPDRWQVERRNVSDRVADALAAFHVAMAEDPKTPAYDVAAHRQLAAAIARAAGGGA